MLKLFSKRVGYTSPIFILSESNKKSNKLPHLTQRSSLLFVHSLRSLLHKNSLQPLRK